MPLRKLRPDSYRVGWICPLEVDQIAAMEMLDEEHQSLEQSPVDHNVYKLGSINGHNVVIAGLHQTGNCPAATVITQMRMTFQKLRHGLLVGTGGGVPVETDDGMIRLGHVVVSKPSGGHSGVIQYDHGKSRDGLFLRTGSLMPPPAVLLNAAQALAVQRARMDYDPVWKDTQRFKTERRGLRRFTFPGVANDHLYQPDYSHQQMGMSCEKGGCNPNQRIERPVDEDDESFVVVHRGTIASGESMITNAKQRDQLAQQHGLLCLEMEAAGVLADFPCMIIRGISNYCDSHKNDDWHGFAAAAAAAYARQLFFHMPIERTQEIYDAQSKPTAFQLPNYLPDISRVSKFIGREGELAQMQEALQSTSRYRRAAILHGLEGIGKTQLAIEYARRHRDEYSATIWLDARDKTAIDQSFTRLAERILRHDHSVTDISIALESQDQSIVVAAVKRWLDEPENDSWLVIYDNYDHPYLSGANAEDEDSLLFPKRSTFLMDSMGREKRVTPESFDIREYMPNPNHGAIIVTTQVSLKELGLPVLISKFESLTDGLSILASASSRKDIKTDAGAADLVRRLYGIPLALTRAGAYLEQVPITCNEYLELYEKSWAELHETAPEPSAYDKVLFITYDLLYTPIEEQSSTPTLLLH